MRVLHVITDLGLGGAQAMLGRLLRSEAWRGDHQTVVSLLDGGQHRPLLEAAGVEVGSLGMRPGRPSLRALRDLRRRIAQARPDLVVSWLYHADLMTTLAWMALGARPVLVWNVRASDMDMSAYSWTSAATRRACGWFSRAPTLILVNSHAGRRAHDLAGYRPRRWMVIPNGIDLNEFRPDPAARDAVRQQLRIPPGDPVVGLLARLDPMKDHATFVAAVLACAERLPTAHFVVAGAGVAPTHPVFEPIVRREDLRSRLHLLGPRTDVAHLLNALDLLTLPSAFGEGFPNVVAEAMACGVPAVVSDVGDAALIVGDLGRVVPPRQPGELAAAWQSILTLPREARRQLGLQVRRKVELEYDIDRVARTYRESMLQLLS